MSNRAGAWEADMGLVYPLSPPLGSGPGDDQRTARVANLGGSAVWEVPIIAICM